MKKKLITKRDICRDLLVKINKAKKLSVFLTVFTVAAIASYILFVVNYADIMVKYTEGHLAVRGFHPAVGLFIGPILILFFVVFLLDFYYIDLLKAAKGKFAVTEEKLYQQKKEQISCYRYSEKENALYFRRGRVSVEEQVYSQSGIGDNFYVVVLRTKKAPRLAYHTKYYEIEECLVQASKN